MASIGVAGSLLAKKRGAPRARWAVLLYFTGMELLQALTYIVIDQCHLMSNIWLTRLSYIHIAFQPFFVNMIAMSFLPDEKAARWRKPVFAVCVLGSAVMMLKFYVPNPVSACNASAVPLCGVDTCSYHGDWHIAWRLYLSALDNSYLSYYLPAFLMPMLYGSWRWSVYHAFVGPMPALLLTSNKDEMAAIWCLMSIGFLLAVHIPFLEHWLATPRRMAAVVGGRTREIATALGGTAGLLLIFAMLRKLTGVPWSDLVTAGTWFGILVLAALGFYVASWPSTRITTRNVSGS